MMIAIGENCSDDNGCFGEGDIPPNSENRPPPADAYDPEGAKAPGKPGSDEGFVDPPGGDDWAPNPNGPGNGWRDADGNVWVPTGHGGRAHGGPHWDVQGLEVEGMRMFIRVDGEGEYEKYPNN